MPARELSTTSDGRLPPGDYSRGALAAIGGALLGAVLLGVVGLAVGVQIGRWLPFEDSGQMFGDMNLQPAIIGGLGLLVGLALGLLSGCWVALRVIGLPWAGEATGVLGAVVVAWVMLAMLLFPMVGLGGFVVLLFFILVLPGAAWLVTASLKDAPAE